MIILIVGKDVKYFLQLFYSYFTRNFLIFGKIEPFLSLSGFRGDFSTKGVKK